MDAGEEAGGAPGGQESFGEELGKHLEDAHHGAGFHTTDDSVPIEPQRQQVPYFLN